MHTTPVDEGYSVAAYFDLAASGAFEDGDHVELLEGLVVASPQQGPLHASVLMAVDSVLRRTIAGRASIRVQMPLIVGNRSVPEPDLAVVAGEPVDYRNAHPTEALLVVEVADSSLAQDRLTKSRIYAAARIPEFWIVNLRDRVVEVRRRPDPSQRVYAESQRFGRDAEIRMVTLPSAPIRVGDLFPGY